MGGVWSERPLRLPSLALGSHLPLRGRTRNGDRVEDGYAGLPRRVSHPYNAFKSRLAKQPEAAPVQPPEEIVLLREIRDALKR